MKYKLFNEYNEDTSIITSILTNRGIQEKDIHHYLNTTDDDIASPLCFGKDVLSIYAACHLSPRTKFSLVVTNLIKLPFLNKAS